MNNLKKMTAEQLLATTKSICDALPGKLATLSAADRVTTMTLAVGRMEQIKASGAPGSAEAAELMSVTFAEVDLFYALFGC